MMAGKDVKNNGWWRAWRDRFTIVVFVSMLALPLAVSLANGFAPRVTKEFRLPTPAPTIGSKFPEQFERWFRDRLGLRHDLVTLFGRISYGIFGVSPTDRVVTGKDGWLFYASAASTPAKNRLVPVHRGLRLLTQEEVGRALLPLKKDRDWLSERGIKHLFVVAPDKHSIYPEMMDPRFTEVSPSRPWGQLREAITESGAVSFVDLHRALVASKSLGRLYDKSDTHWNELGAAVAAQEIISALRAWFPVLAPLRIPETVSWETQPGMGLARVMGLDHWLVESSPRLHWENERRSEEVEPAVIFSGPMHAAYRDRLSRSVAAVTRIDSSPLPRAVVVQDSFGVLLQPLLSEYFSEVVYVLRLADRRLLAAFLDVYRPDVVIDEIVERRLLGLHFQPSFADR